MCIPSSKMPRCLQKVLIGAAKDGQKLPISGSRSPCGEASTGVATETQGQRTRRRGLRMGQVGCWGSRFLNFLWLRPKGDLIVQWFSCIHLDMAVIWILWFGYFDFDLAVSFQWFKLPHTLKPLIWMWQHEGTDDIDTCAIMQLHDNSSSTVSNCTLTATIMVVISK